MLKKITLLTFIAFFSFSSFFTVQARWALPKEAPVEFEIYNRDIVVKKDKVEEVVEYRAKILNERGREEYSVFKTFFNQNISEIEIVEAKSSHQNQDFVVPEKNIEIKPVASELNSFDQMMQASVTFPNVSIGSTVYIKFKIRTLKQPLPDYFSQTFSFYQSGIFKQLNINIQSELRLHTLMNDPRQSLTMSESTSGDIQTISIRLKDGINLYEELLNESPRSLLSGDRITHVMVSTCDSFEELAKASAVYFEKTINEPLPPLLETISKEAQTGLTVPDQINIVTSRLAEKIRYLTDKTTIEGRFAPRPLQITVESALGDCKDFSAATVAILRSLGHKAQIVFVRRGSRYIVPKKLLPSLEHIDHAMVKVTTQKGEIFWIDPTNTVSLAAGLFPDIANRPALVLDLEHPSYEFIPEIDPLHSQIKVESEMTLIDPLTHVTGTITMTGEKSLLLAGSALFQSEQVIKEQIIKRFYWENHPLEMNVKLPDLASRIVPDTTLVEYSFKQENDLLLTNMGKAIQLAPLWDPFYSQIPNEGEGVIYVGYPESGTQITVIKNIESLDLNSLDFSFNTPWIQANRTCEIKEGNTVITDKHTILKRFILPEEIKSSEFKVFKETIKKYCKNVALILPKSPYKN